MTIYEREKEGGLISKSDAIINKSLQFVGLKCCLKIYVGDKVNPTCHLFPSLILQNPNS